MVEQTVSAQVILVLSDGGWRVTLEFSTGDAWMSEETFATEREASAAADAFLAAHRVQ